MSQVGTATVLRGGNVEAGSEIKRITAELNYKL